MKRDGLKEELVYWETWLKTQGQCQNIFPAEFSDRLNPSLPLQPEFRRLIPEGQVVARILDVGAGPLTHIGKFATDLDLHVTAIDELALEYDELLEKYNVVPPLRTKYCDAADLHTTFSSNFFDVVCFRNSLDHCDQPVRSLLSALKITRPRGFIFLEHVEFEGQKAHYTGLHHFDLYQEDGDFFIAGRGITTNISLYFQNMVKISVDYNSLGWIVVTMQKL